MPAKDSKLSVAFLYDDSLDANDGVAQYVKTLGAWLSAKGHQVTYLSGEASTKSYAGGRVVSLSRNIKVSFNGNRLSMPVYSSRRLIKRTLAAGDFDVLHVQVPYSPLMAARVIKAAGPGVAVVGTFHIFPSGWLSKYGSRLLRVVLWRNLTRLDKVVSVSRAAAQFAKNTFGLETTVLPNAVELAGFKTAARPKPWRIVFLGRLVERKGCWELIKAFELLHRQLPQAELIIGGDGPKRPQLEKYVNDRGLSGCVEFRGFIAEADKPRFLAESAVACFPSLYGESFGIVLVEAMAAGAQVVLGGDNPGYRSVLEERDQLLIDPRDTAAFAARLKLLLSDAALAGELHAWQRSVVRQYDVNKVGERLLSLYRTVIDIKNKNEHNKRNES